MDQQESNEEPRYNRDGKYDAFSIWVPNCHFRGSCVTKDNARTTFCPCVLRIGMQETGNNVKIYCDLVEQLEDTDEG